MDKLTRRLLAQSRVIAKGERIRDVQRLPTFGGYVWRPEVKMGQEE